MSSHHYLMPIAVVALYTAGVALTKISEGWRVSGGYPGRVQRRELAWHGAAALALAGISFALTWAEELIPGGAIGIPFVLGLIVCLAIAKRHRQFKSARKNDEHWDDDYLRRWGMKSAEEKADGNSDEA